MTAEEIVALKRTIKRQLKNGKYKNADLARKFHCSPATVTKYKNMVEGELSVADFLKLNWHWTGNVIPTSKKDGKAKPKKRDSKYRVVHPGDRGNLRTPTRTDGRFQ